MSPVLIFPFLEPLSLKAMANSTRMSHSSVRFKGGRCGSIVARVGHKRADLVAATVIGFLKPCGLLLNTLTSDKGKEFAHHETIAPALEIASKFAHPYASWGNPGLMKTGTKLSGNIPSKKPIFYHL